MFSFIHSNKCLFGQTSAFSGHFFRVSEGFSKNFKNFKNPWDMNRFMAGGREVESFPKFSFFLFSFVGIHNVFHYEA